MPSTSVFDRQDAAYQDAVLPPALPAVAVEAAHPDFWRKYVGRRGRVVGIDHFGDGPGAGTVRVLRPDPGQVAQAVREVLA